MAIKTTWEKLRELPLPSIIQLSDRGEFFYVLKKCTDDGIVYYDDKGKPMRISQDEFIKRWTGICLLVETSENSGEPDIQKKLVEKRVMDFLKATIATFLLIWAIMGIVKSPATMDVTSTFFISAYALLKLVGLSIGVMLLWYEVDKNNPTLQSFCSGDTVENGKKIDCNAVLGSKHAQLFNGSLSLSLIGFSYFFGSLVYLTTTGYAHTSLGILGCLSIMAFPVLLVSLYYQAIVIKQWCRFCIAIQLVLAAEILITYMGGFYRHFNGIESLPLLIALLLLPIAFWKWAKPLIGKTKRG